MDTGEGYLINGRKDMSLRLKAGEGQVLDLAHGTGRHLLEVEAEEGCRMRLLALDGVDLEEPRNVPYVGLVALQRARVLLTCPTAGASALVTRASSSRNDASSSPEIWDQRLLSLTVTKGLPFSRLPSLPVHSRSKEGTSGYLRDLRDRHRPISSCSVSLACPRGTSCTGGLLLEAHASSPRFTATFSQ